VPLEKMPSQNTLKVEIPFAIKARLLELMFIVDDLFMGG
jgi:hypothetical protein